MINDQEKIEFLLNRLKNLEQIIKSFIDNAEILKDKYSLEEELKICDIKKAVILGKLQDLGYSLNPLTNQG